MKEKNHYQLVIDQAAEYSLMGEFISYNYKNPLIIGADHPLMKFFIILRNLYLLYIYLKTTRFRL